MAEVSPNLARTMLDYGGTLIVIGMPANTEFGIDMESWHVGIKFKGMKMIPPGLHFIYFSARNKDGQTAPRTGFFHVFGNKEVLVKNYNILEEDLEDETDMEQVERIKMNLKNLDGDLGPYPHELWSKWISFTQYIHPEDIKRMHPLSGKVCSAPELVIKMKQISDTVDGNAENIAQISEQALFETQSGKQKSYGASSCSTKGLPDMEPRPGTELRFSKFPDKPFREGASPIEVTRGNIDSTYTIQFVYNQLNKPEDILGELQFSFVCFLVGQVWDSWEHWRKLVIAFCMAEENLINHPDLYLPFLSILHYQIEEVPEDLFVDIVESSNFLAASLTTLFANIIDNASTLPKEIVLKAQKFRRHLITKFKWSLTLEEEGEDAPIVVDLDAS